MTDIEPIKKDEQVKQPIDVQDLKHRAFKIAQDIRELHRAMGLAK